jgi:putative ABC transport system permease protein
MAHPADLLSSPIRWARDVVRDAAYALRQLRREPLVAMSVMLTLAIGIGATSAIFTVVNSVLLKPLPYRDPDRLVALAGFSYRGEFVEMKAHARTVDVAAYTEGRDVTITGRGEPLRIAAATLSPEIFPVLGMSATLGRALADGDSRPGAEPVVLLSTGLWQAQFGGDPGAIGQRLMVDGTARTIVGVLPSRFAFPSHHVHSGRRS